MLPNTISKGHGSPRVPKSKKSDDMSKILDLATRILDQYMEKWPLVVFEATEEESELLLSVRRSLDPLWVYEPS